MPESGTIVSMIGLTVADVRRAMGLMSSVTTYDSYIEDVIRAKADLIMEDMFTAGEIADMTKNQKLRAVEGLACLLAADCLLLIPTNFLLNNGDENGGSFGGGQSITLGPISVGAWTGSSGMSGLRNVAAQLRERGTAILQDLHIVNSRGGLAWKAVGTTEKPVYTGGRRKGIRSHNPAWMDRSGVS